jgi:hypothetical protein
MHAPLLRDLGHLHRVEPKRRPKWFVSVRLGRSADSLVVVVRPAKTAHTVARPIRFVPALARPSQLVIAF